MWCPAEPVLDLRELFVGPQGVQIVWRVGTQGQPFGVYWPFNRRHISEDSHPVDGHYGNVPGPDSRRLLVCQVMRDDTWTSAVTIPAFLHQGAATPAVHGSSSRGRVEMHWLLALRAGRMVPRDHMSVDNDIA